MRDNLNWNPPADWLSISTIDAHTAGEPLRVVASGFPDLPGETILEKRRYARENYDHLRTALMWEPRGHADMYGCIPTKPVTPDGDLGVLFLHNAGFSTMCGHGIIGLVKVALDTGMLSLEGDRYLFNFLMVYPGTELETRSKELGLNPVDNMWEKVHTATFQVPVVETARLTVSDLSRLYVETNMKLDKLFKKRKRAQCK